MSLKIKKNKYFSKSEIFCRRTSLRTYVMKCVIAIKTGIAYEKHTILWWIKLSALHATDVTSMTGIDSYLPTNFMVRSNIENIENINKIEFINRDVTRALFSGWAPSISSIFSYQ